MTGQRPTPIRSFGDTTEREIIAATPSPRTRASLAADLRSLGLRGGDTIIVHTSVRSLGWVNGGAVAYLQALMDVLTVRGTLVMPTQTSHISDPAGWRHPPVPAEWVKEVRATMPAFDPARTPTRRMGAAPELFRTWPGVLRSNHPSSSFAAWGRHAGTITSHHGPQRIGEESPAARLYEVDARVLLVGVGYERNTCFHLAEYRAQSSNYVQELMPLVKDGKVLWTEVTEVEFMDEPSLIRLGAEFEAACSVTRGKVGNAECRLFSVRDCVDFAVKWLGDAHASG
jgi:aminoglycoside 3-N-acetyltransferase